MIRRDFAILAVACLVAAIPGQPAGGQTAAQNAPNLPTVAVLATGGTIAGAASTNVQAGYTSGQVGVDQLIAAVSTTGFRDLTTRFRKYAVSSMVSVP